MMTALIFEIFGHQKEMVINIHLIEADSLILEQFN